MSRKTSEGDEIGSEYQAACIASWKESGFSPVTVNSNAEILSDQVTVKTSVVRLEQDASSIYGKPYPFMTDFFEAISKSSNGVVAFTNSDILIRLSSDQQLALTQLKEDECIILKRKDVASLTSTEGKEYRPGYDFFAVHASRLKDIQAGAMAIGIPWWDHFLPLHLMLSGLRHVNIGACIFHLEHEERWDQKNWISVGNEFETILQESLTERYAANHALETYFDRADRARSNKGVEIKTRVRRELNFLTGRKKRREDAFYLNRLSNANILTIDEWRHA